jgi:CheY-like chemotaxis protein
MKKVLIVDDDPVSRKIVSKYLEKRDYYVLTANDGLQGIDIALTELPNIVLTDIQMPIIDGYQLIVALRTHPQTAKIPVILMTEIANDASYQQATELGVKAYFAKPLKLNSPDLILAIEAAMAATHQIV